MIEIAVAIITAIGTIVAVVITTRESGKKLTAEFATKVEVARAVTDTKIDELTREVREHNNFARRLPVVENEISHIKERLCQLDKVAEADSN